jgi:hypothetical protein
MGCPTNSVCFRDQYSCLRVSNQRFQTCSGTARGPRRPEISRRTHAGPPPRGGVFVKVHRKSPHRDPKSRHRSVKGVVVPKRWHTLTTMPSQIPAARAARRRWADPPFPPGDPCSFRPFPRTGADVVGQRRDSEFLRFRIRPSRARSAGEVVHLDKVQNARATPASKGGHPVDYRRDSVLLRSLRSSPLF